MSGVYSENVRKMFGAWSECMGHRHGVGGEAWGTAGRVRNMFGNSLQIVGCRDVFRNNEALGRWPAFGRTTHSSRPLPGPYRPYRQRNHVPKFRESALALAAHPPSPLPRSPTTPNVQRTWPETFSKLRPTISKDHPSPHRLQTPDPRRQGDCTRVGKEWGEAHGR